MRLNVCVCLMKLYNRVGVMMRSCFTRRESPVEACAGQYASGWHCGPSSVSIGLVTSVSRYLVAFSVASVPPSVSGVEECVEVIWLSSQSDSYSDTCSRGYTNERLRWYDAFRGACSICFAYVHPIRKDIGSD